MNFECTWHKQDKDKSEAQHCGKIDEEDHADFFGNLSDKKYLLSVQLKIGL